MKGLMNVAPALAAKSAWFALKQRVTFTILPSPDSILQAFSPSQVSGNLTVILEAIFASLRPSAIMAFDSVATTSALTGPETKSQISLVTSIMSRPDFMIKDGFVVTPSTIPRSFNSAIASISAVSTKNFMTYVLDRLAFVDGSFTLVL